METKFSSVLLSTLLLFLALAHAFPDQTSIPGCPPLSCGGATIDAYPFWMSSSSAAPNSTHCGFPGLDIVCLDGNLTKQTTASNYLILNISLATRTVSLVDRDLLTPCPKPFHNLTYDSTHPLYYPPTVINYTFYSNCLSTTTLPNDIPCLSDGTNGKSYLVPPEDPNGSYLYNHCQEMAVVPVLSGSLSISGFEGIKKMGFQLTWDQPTGQCRDCESSGGRCGFRKDPVSRFLSYVCLCIDGEHPSSCPPEERSHKLSVVKKVAIGVSGMITTLVFLLLILCVYKLCKKMESTSTSTSTNQSIEAFLITNGPLAIKRYKYSELKQMTTQFSSKLGKGGYGSVYKGQLPDGTPVAVKVLTDTKGSGEDFINEVASIGRTNHINVVTLLGYCSQGSKRALVYEFMPNGSLEKFLFVDHPKTTTQLGWEQLHMIALGIAKGLEYIHRGCNTRMVHFDIKPHNILLDEDFCPKISDFGLAKLYTRQESILSTVCARGTIGYIAPEVFSRNFGVVSSKSDVYSYGMMLLEMVGGRRNVKNGVSHSSEMYFPHWIYENFDQDIALQACGVTAGCEDLARKMILVGLWCIQTNPNSRPSIGKVREMLEGSVSSLEIPPKPYICSPEISGHNTIIDSFATSTVPTCIV